MEQKKNKVPEPLRRRGAVRNCSSGGEFYFRTWTWCQWCNEKCCCYFHWCSCTILLRKIGIRKRVQSGSSWEPDENMARFLNDGGTCWRVFFRCICRTSEIESRTFAKNNLKKATFSCFDRRSVFWFWSRTWKRMYQWISPERNGSIVSWRVHYNDGNFWNCLCSCLFFQEELDIGPSVKNLLGGQI